MPINPNVHLVENILDLKSLDQKLLAMVFVFGLNSPCGWRYMRIYGKIGVCITGQSTRRN